MNEDKVYYPDEISDSPLPNRSEVPTFSISESSGENKTPSTTKSNSFPSKKYAVELLSSALNTRSKKILQEFQFTVSGALAIGTYENGVSGDIRISPNGIVARNAAGLTTFALDGTTGGAVFSGEIQSGSTVTGRVVIGDNKAILDEDGLTIYGGAITVFNEGDAISIDSKGIRSTTNFVITNSANNSLSQVVGTTSGTDVTGATLTFSLDRPKTVLFLDQTTHFLNESVGNTCNAYVAMFLDGVETAGATTRMQLFSGSATGRTAAGHYIAVNLDAGSHTIKLVAVVNIVSGTTATMTIYSFALSYIILGT